MTKFRRIYLRFLFFNASVANIVFAFCLVFAFEHLSHWLGVETVPDTPLLSMYATLFAISVLMFGIAYFIAGWWPTSETSFCLVAFGTAGKFAVFGVMLTYALTTDVSWGHARLTFVDFLYAILFIEYLIWFRRFRSRPG